MKRTTIQIYSLRTVDWFENKVIDWNSAGTQYLENGETKQLQKYHFGFVCYGSITSENGEYIFIYQKLRTKGLLLKNGELLREINRSYYQSDAYEFPATFVTYQNKTYLVHCPLGYNQIDFENAETSEIITNIPKREPQDIFHSRLEVSSDNKYLMSKGWVWYPCDVIEVFEIEKCLENPHLLDNGITPSVDFEINVASFMDNDKVLICSSHDLCENEESAKNFGQMAIWNIESNQVSDRVCIKAPCGNIFAIDDKQCWDLYEYPKIIDLKTGEVKEKKEEINSGKQGSSITYEEGFKIAFNQHTKQMTLYETALFGLLLQIYYLVKVPFFY